MFSLAEAWGWNQSEVLQLPVSRRKRALRWIREMNMYQRSRQNGDNSPFDREAFTDSVWLAPIGEGFGDL